MRFYEYKTMHDIIHNYYQEHDIHSLDFDLLCNELMPEQIDAIVSKEDLECTFKNAREPPSSCPICLGDKRPDTEWVRFTECGHHICVRCATSLSHQASVIFPNITYCMCRQPMDLYYNFRIETRFCYTKIIKWSIITSHLMIFRNEFSVSYNVQYKNLSSLYSLPTSLITSEEYCIMYCNKSLNNTLEKCYRKFLRNKNLAIQTIFLKTENDGVHPIFVNFYNGTLSTGYYTIGKMVRNLESAADKNTAYGGYFL